MIATHSNNGPHKKLSAIERWNPDRELDILNVLFSFCIRTSRAVSAGLAVVMPRVEQVSTAMKQYLGVVVDCCGLKTFAQWDLPSGQAEWLHLPRVGKSVLVPASLF
jgi:hypothetical protein